MSKKIAVLGTGANGSCIAADLVSAGLDVTLIDQWPDHVETMRRDGLHISLPDQELHVEVDAHHICDLCSLNRLFDIVLLCVKAYDTRWTTELIKPYLAENAIVVGVQNCMTADDISEIVGQDRTIGCVVVLASEMFEPGKVKRSVTRENTWFGLGALTPQMEERIAEVEAVMRHVGKVAREDDIRSAKWTKLVVNTMSMGPQAILGLNSGEAGKLPGMQELLMRCGEEALRAGESLGFRIEPVFGMSREELEGSNRLPELLLENIYKNVGTTFIDTVSQDHMKGRLSEVDLINGVVAEENARTGIDSSANRAIVEITRRIHAGELELSPSNLDLALEMIKKE